MSVGSPPSWLLSEPLPFAPRRFTVEEYRRLGEAGVLGEDDRVELLEGVITPKMMHSPPHDATITLVEQALRAYLPEGWIIRIQSSITTADSEPEPDLALVGGSPRDYAARHPVASDVALVVEVADSSLLRDRTKARLYARAGVPTYWIVNLADAQIEVQRQPSGAGNAPAYQRLTTYGRGDVVPLILSSDAIGKIAVDDLLP